MVIIAYGEGQRSNEDYNEEAGKTSDLLIKQFKDEYFTIFNA